MDQQKDIFMMTGEEIQRYQIIRKVLEREINQQEASEFLKLSDRQIRRIVKRVKTEGESQGLCIARAANQATEVLKHH